MKDLLTLSLPGYTNVQAPNGVPQSLGQNAGPFGQSLIATGFELLFVFAVIFALIMIIISGINWITSQGDKQKLQQARTRLTYSIIGLLVVFIAFFVVGVIGYVFGVKLFG